jgi:hypothetical protein
MIWSKQFFLYDVQCRPNTESKSAQGLPADPRSNFVSRNRTVTGSPRHAHVIERGRLAGREIPLADTCTASLRRPVTAMMPLIVNTATKHSMISELIMALPASGVTTNSVITSIRNNAVKLYSCSQNRMRFDTRETIANECLSGAGNIW